MHDNNDLTSMSKRIRDCRKRLGLTQEKLAEKAGISPQFVSYAESGTRCPNSINLLRIAKALNVSTDYLLTGLISDSEFLYLTDELRQLTPEQIQGIKRIISEFILLFSHSNQQ